MLKIETSLSKFAEQEQFYITLRKKEGRLYKDDEVKELPRIVKKHPLIKEWRVRKHSARKLVNYLIAKAKPLKVLEIGCGNGWLCHQLSYIPGSVITGLDINTCELEQAERVFGNIPNINFVFGDIFEDILSSEKYDIIIFASSIQYFSNIKHVIDRVIPLLYKNAEIHSIDSPVYKLEKDAFAAGERSKSYFEMNGVNDMAKYYHHHTYSFLQKFNHRVIRPNLPERLFGLSYFPWIIIKPPRF